MNHPPTAADPIADADCTAANDGSLACVLCINASDPTGAGGIAADIVSITSAGAHALPVVTGAYARDTTEVLDFFPLEEEAVTGQARAVLEDMPVQVIKVGFAHSPSLISAIAELASDYADVPLIAAMPDLGWWDDSRHDTYQTVLAELLLPQASVLVGNHNTLWRWLLPDWESARSPGPRDLAKAAAQYGVPYVLVSGILLPDQQIETAVATPQAVLASQRFERFDASFIGAGDTLSATLAALLATGSNLQDAFKEALQYLDGALHAGFRPGMGHALPDRLFWAQPDDDSAQGDAAQPLLSDPAFHETRH